MGKVLSETRLLKEENDMKQTKDVKVPFTRANAKKCICWQCTVQLTVAVLKRMQKKWGKL